MRVLVFFDLPNVTSAEKRNYRKFRKFLIKSGFIMLQESVYAKLTLNQTAAAAVMQSVRKNKPESGLVQMLLITEKQFAKMEIISGKSNSNVIDTDERLLIL